MQLLSLTAKSLTYFFDEYAFSVIFITSSWQGY